MTAPMFTRSAGPGRPCRLCRDSGRRTLTGALIKLEHIPPPQPGVFDVSACPVCDDNPRTLTYPYIGRQDRP